MIDTSKGDGIEIKPEWAVKIRDAIETSSELPEGYETADAIAKMLNLSKSHTKALLKSARKSGDVRYAKVKCSNVVGYAYCIEDIENVAGIKLKQE